MNEETIPEVKTIVAYLTDWIMQPGHFFEKLGSELGLSAAAMKQVMQGSLRFPIQKIPELGKAIDIEPRDLLRAALTEQMPDLMRLIDEHMLPTPVERRLLHVVSKYSDGRHSGPFVIEGRTVIALIAN